VVPIDRRGRSLALKANVFCSSIGDKRYEESRYPESERKPLYFLVSITLINPRTHKDGAKHQPHEYASWHLSRNSNAVDFLSTLIHFVEVGGFLGALFAAGNGYADVDNAGSANGLTAGLTNANCLCATMRKAFHSM